MKKFLLPRDQVVQNRLTQYKLLSVFKQMKNDYRDVEGNVEMHLN